MSCPAVTVLMAVYNTEAYLQEAIDSVLTQTLSDLELLIVDDGSKDRSWSIISAAAARDDRIVARRCPSNRGASRALNEGLGMARGAYITRQDADDVSLPTRLAEQVAFLQSEPGAGAVGTQAILVDSDGKRLSETSFPTTNAEIQASLIEAMSFVGPTVMARRTAFAQAGLWFDDALSGTEDYDLCLRLSEVAAIGNIGRPLYIYRQHGASVSHRQRHQQLARKAMAVENAVRRRHGADGPAASWIAVARDYLRAAIVAHMVHETAASHMWVDKALGFYPGIFADGVLVEPMLRRYLKAVPEDGRVSFAETLFAEVLPQTRSLRSLHRRLLAELHMSALLAEHAEPGDVSNHLWPAIRSNPACLFKRQVLALLVKSAVGRTRATGSGLRP
jgi:glycosyltransferase involved in cell wall biosynthesis